MYVDNAVKQLNSANDFLQQQAAEDYNRKMANLQALNLAIKTGNKEERDLWQKRLNRSGIIGALGDIKDAILPNRPEDSQHLDPSTITIGKNAFQSQKMGTPQVNLEKNVIGNTAAMSQEQRNILLNNKLNDKQQAFMLADKEYRRTHGGQPLSIQEFNKMYENQLISGYVSDNKNKDGYIVTEPEIQDNAQKRVEFLKQIQAEKDLQGGQQNLVNKQLAIDKNNKDAMALNAKAQQAKDNTFEGYMQKRGNMVKQYEGDWGNMSAQNLAMFRDAYNYYIDKDPSKAKQILGEYKMNQQNINKFWQEDPNAGLALDAFKAPKGAEKTEDRYINVTFVGNTQPIQIGINKIPVKYLSDPNELLKYFRSKGGAFKNATSATAFKAYDDAIQNAFIQGQGNKELESAYAQAGNKYYVDNAVMDDNGNVIKAQLIKPTYYTSDKGVTKASGIVAKIIENKKAK